MAFYALNQRVEVGIVGIRKPVADERPLDGPRLELEHVGTLGQLIIQGPADFGIGGELSQSVSHCFDRARASVLLV